MRRIHKFTLFGALIAGTLPAWGGELRGKFKSADTVKHTITLTIEEQPRSLEVAADAKITALFGRRLKKAETMDVPGGFSGIRECAPLTATTEIRDGREVVTSIKLDELQPPPRKKGKKK